MHTLQKHTLTWLHTRKNTPMKLIGTWSQIWIRIMIVRSVHPKHPMSIDNKPV